MILSRGKVVDRFNNGKVKYIETRAIVAPLWTANYPNKRVSEDGTLWVRIGENTKFKMNGDVEWSIKYDSYGNIVKE